MEPTPWWLYGLSSLTQRGRRFPTEHEVHSGKLDDQQAMEVNSYDVVCFTSELEAAPIFPVVEPPSIIPGFALPENPYCETYIYVMALPEATVPTSFIPGEEDIKVVDMHAIQLEQSRAILARNPKLNPHFVTQGLCGYEAFADKIEPESIVCAIKCRRTPLQALTAGLRVYVNDDVYMIPFEREFQLDTSIFFNAQFVEDEAQPLKAAAFTQLQAAIKKGRQATTNVADALEQSGIPVDPAKSHKTKLFWYHLSHYRLWSAFLTIWESGKNLVSSLKEIFVGNELYNHPNFEANEVNVDCRLGGDKEKLRAAARASSFKAQSSFGKPLHFFGEEAIPPQRSQEEVQVNITAPKVA